MANLLKAITDPRYEGFNYDEKRRALFGITGDERAKAMTDAQLDELSQKLAPVTSTVTGKIEPPSPVVPSPQLQATLDQPALPSRQTQRLRDTINPEEVVGKPFATPEDAAGMVGQFFTGMAGWGAGEAAGWFRTSLEHGGPSFWPSRESGRKTTAWVEEKAQELADYLFPLTDEGRKTYEQTVGKTFQTIMTPANMTADYIEKLLKDHPNAQPVIGDMTRLALELLTLKGLHVGGKTLGGAIKGKPEGPIDLTDVAPRELPPPPPSEAPPFETRGRPYTPQRQPQLPPGQEFGLQGGPYEGLPVRGPGRQVAAPQGEPLVQLPPGQGFELVPRESGWPYVPPEWAKQREVTDASRIREDAGRLYPGRDVQEGRPGEGRTDMELQAPQEPGRAEAPAPAQEVAPAPDPFTEPTELGAGVNFFPKRFREELTKRMALIPRESKEYKAATSQLEKLNIAEDNFKTIYAPTPGIALSEASSKYIMDGKADSFIDNLPSIIMPGAEGPGITPRQVWRYGGQEAREGIASHKDRLGYTPEITRKGGYASKDFTDALDAQPKDLTKGADYFSGPHWWVPKLEGTQTGNTVADHILRPINDTEVAKTAFQGDQYSTIQAIAQEAHVTRGSKADIVLEDIAAQISTEDLSLPLSKIAAKPEVEAVLRELPQSEWAPMLRGAIMVRQRFNDMLRLMNRARTEVYGLEPIGELTNYVSHMRERNVWNRIGDIFRKETPEGAIPDYIHPSRPFNPVELPRTAKGEYKRVRGAVNLLTRYADITAAQIYDTAIVQHLRAHAKAARNRPGELAKPHLADALDSLGDIYAGWKAPIDRWFEGSKTTSAAAKIINYTGRGIKKGALVGNIAFSLLKQWTSVANTVALTDIVSATAANFKMWRPSTWRRMEQHYGSIVKRQESQEFTGVSGGPKLPKELRSPGIWNAWYRMMSTGLKEMERLTVIHAGTAAEIFGKKKGYTGRDLSNITSDTMLKSQSAYNRTGLPGILRNRVVSNTFTFQTFYHDVMNIALQTFGKSGAYKDFTPTQWGRIKAMARWGAAIFFVNAVNQKVSGRSPWTAWSFVPFLGSIMGGGAKTPGNVKAAPVQYFTDLRAGIRSFYNHGDPDKLIKWGLTWNFRPGGGGQIWKTIEGTRAILMDDGRIKDEQDRMMYRIDDEIGEYIKAVTLGPGYTKAGVEYYKRKY